MFNCWKLIASLIGFIAFQIPIQAVAGDEQPLIDAPPISVAASAIFSPMPVIDILYKEDGHTVISISSVNSKDNLGRELKYLWTVYRINFTEQNEETYAFLGTFKEDAEINQGLTNAYPGLYAIVLTVINADGISNSSEKYIRVEPKANARLYAKATKAAIKKLIYSFRNGIAGSMAREYLSGSAYSKIERYVLPRLEKLLTYEAIFSDHVIGGMIDGFMAAGMSSSNARVIAEVIYWTFF